MFISYLVSGMLLTGIASTHGTVDRRIVGSILPGGPIEIFLLPANAAVNQKE